VKLSKAIASLLAMILFATTVMPMAAGEPSVQQLHRDGRQLTLEISQEFEPAMQQNLADWVDFLADTLHQVYGYWPQQQWHVVINPTSGRTGDPIPWAQVKRDPVHTVEFYTVASASADELRRAWTGYHELAHLLIPYRGWGDAWFSEGLASYYQNVLQARAGLLSEQQMWQKLYEGYIRGVQQSQFNGIELHTVSDNMRSNGGFMRVYWSGAWYFLTADAQLRQQSGGRTTLDDAIKKLNQCCSRERLSVPQMVRKLDQLNGSDLFVPLYEKTRTTTETPDFLPVMQSMGVIVNEGRVQLLGNRQQASLRRQIIGRRTL
tara:strand:+ start:62782 stop:63741 length:960 start_codon:yes stop_codon:yes gene_type:complete